MSTVRPDFEDIEAIERDPEFANCSLAEKYRLAQATKYIRAFKGGKLDELFEELDGPSLRSY